MFWNKYPYTDFHELNLDIILRIIKDLHQEWDEFKVINAITFGGEWNITKQYPAWCIVNWNNGQEGYISIKPVPAGVTIDNTEYWVSVVNYTATIADLQNRVVSLENTVGDASSGLVKDVNDLKTVVGDASSGIVKDVNDLENDVDDLKDAVSDILVSDNSDVIALGDSWALTGGWPDNLENYLPHKTFRKAGTGGIGFVGGDYQSQLASVAAAMTSDEKDDVDLIIQSCSINDYGNSYADIKSAVTSYLTYAQTTFPNAKIILVNVNKWFIGTYNRGEYFAAAQEAAIDFHDVLFMDVTNSYDWNSYIDGAHLSSAGYKLVAMAIYTKLMGGGSGLNTNYVAFPIYVGYGDNGNSLYKQVTGEVKDGVARLDIPTYEYSNLSVTASIITTIAGSIKGMTGYETENAFTGQRFNVIGFVTTTDNVQYTVPIRVDITGNGVITHTIITPSDMRSKTIRNMYIDATTIYVKL